MTQDTRTEQPIADTADAATAALQRRDDLLAKIKAEMPRHDPMVAALFDRLPPPGADWPQPERIKWLTAAGHVFDLVYGGNAGAFKIMPV